MTEQTTETPVWDAGVAEEHKSAVSGFVQDGKLNIPGICKGYSELFTKMGSSTKIPTADSPAEEVSAFYKKIGKPDTAEDYTPPDLPKGQEMDKDVFSGWAAVAHEANLSDAQFTSFANKYMELLTQQKEVETTEFNRHREETDRKLHETYGADYDANIELSKRAYTEYANDELKELLKTDKYVGIMNESAFIDMMVQIGKKNMNDTFVRSDSQVEVKKDDYKPGSPNSPTMYTSMESEEGKKARAYFRAKGHVYDRSD